MVCCIFISQRVFESTDNSLLIKAIVGIEINGKLEMRHFQKYDILQTIGNIISYDKALNAIFRSSTRYKTTF